jgi:hypothetical protein
MARLSRRNFIITAPAAAATLACGSDLISKTTAEGSHFLETSAGSQSHLAGSIAMSELNRNLIFSSAIRDTYEDDKLDQVSMPMGGIGTGCIGFSGTGRLIDSEKFNNPNRGYQPFYCFIYVFAQEVGGKPAFRVLEGQLPGSLEGPLYLTKDMWQAGNGCGPKPRRQRACRACANASSWAAFHSRTLNWISFYCRPRGRSGMLPQPVPARLSRENGRKTKEAGAERMRRLRYLFQ